MLWYTLLIAAVAVERIAERVVSRRNWVWSKERGGSELGAGHYPVLVVVLAAQGLRCWCITTLGHQWNTRVVVIPAAPLVTGGPYRMIPHPNYVAVVVEGFALPLVHSAWFTALVFTVCNATLLRTRIKVENSALAGLV